MAYGDLQIARYAIQVMSVTEHIRYCKAYYVLRHPSKFELKKNVTHLWIWIIQIRHRKYAAPEQ